MCLPSGNAPKAPPPPPPPPPAPEETATKVAAATGVREAQALAARLGTASLQIPFSSVNIPRP